MSNRILVLEDDPQRVAWFREHALNTPIDVTDSAAAAIELLRTNEYRLIFLDHDLTAAHYSDFFNRREPDDQTTGYAAAVFLAENSLLSENAEIVCHSFNEKAADRMWRKMRETRRFVRKTPFNQLSSN